MKDNKEFINGIYQKYDEYLKERNEKNMGEENKEKFTPVKNTKAKDFEKHAFMKRNFVKFLSAAAVFTIVLSGVLVSKNLLNNGETIVNGLPFKSSKKSDLTSIYLSVNSSGLTYLPNNNSSSLLLSLGIELSVTLIRICLLVLSITTLPFVLDKF